MGWRVAPDEVDGDGSPSACEAGREVGVRGRAPVEPGAIRQIFNHQSTRQLDDPHLMKLELHT